MIRIFCVVCTLLMFMTSFTSPASAGSWWEAEQELLTSEFVKEVFTELPSDKKFLADFIKEYTITPCSFHVLHYKFWKDMKAELDQTDAETLFPILWKKSHEISAQFSCGPYVRS